MSASPRVRCPLLLTPDHSWRNQRECRARDRSWLTSSASRRTPSGARSQKALMSVPRASSIQPRPLKAVSSTKRHPAPLGLGPPSPKSKTANRGWLFQCEAQGCAAQTALRNGGPGGPPCPSLRDQRVEEWVSRRGSDQSVSQTNPLSQRRVMPAKPQGRLPDHGGVFSWVT